MVSFIVWESDGDFNVNKVLSFKTTVCNNLKLVRTEVTFVCRIRGLEQEIVFQLPSEALPLLRHCTGWRKEWLFSLNVRKVRVHNEPAITVQEQKISQLRLQEDPGTLGDGCSWIFRAPKCRNEATYHFKRNFNPIVISIK